MSDLIIIMDREPDSPFAWGLTANGKAGRARTAAEKSALSSLSYRRLIAVIPGQLVVTKLHTLGQLNDKQKRQAAGFSIEEELAASLDECHIALDNHGARLAVVANWVMDAVVGELKNYGLSPDIICADYDSFEIADSFTFENRIVQRSGNGLGFAAEINLASIVLDPGQSIPVQIDSAGFFQKITEALAAGHSPINLRQGHYSKHGQTGAGRFKRSALLAAAIVLAFVGGTVLQGYMTSRKTKVLQAQINEIYGQIYPGQDIPKNPVRAVIRAQSDLNAGNNQVFINLSTLLAQSTRQVDGVEIASIRYETTKGQLSLSITYSSFDDVEKLKRIVASFGGSFAESGTRQSGNKLSGDAILRLKS